MPIAEVPSPLTVVYLHAHPDDEASGTAGTMALLADTGHRVVVVYATNGDHGEVPEDLGTDTLPAYRRREAEASAKVTGTARVAWLDYADSGMQGWEHNEHPGSFHAAPTDEAAGRLAAILDEEDADVLVGYDWHGGYGHPDHVKVHHVARRAVELARRRPRYLESTMSRDRMREIFLRGRAAGMDAGWDPDGPMDDGNPFGTPESEIQWQVDVSTVLDRKRAALACHASQRSDVGMMLAMPPEIFAEAFGAEHYIEPGLAGPMRAGWPFGVA